MDQTVARSLHLITGLPPRGYAAERWRCDFDKTVTAFGRLVYLGSLLDICSGMFSHEGLELRCGKQAARELIRDAYATTLAVWLSYDAAQQEREIRTYFAALEANGAIRARSAGA